MLALRLSTWKSEIYRYKFLNNLFLVKILLYGTALGHFRQSIFKFFCRRPTMMDDIFNQFPLPHHHHKKASYEPDINIVAMCFTPALFA